MTEFTPSRVAVIGLGASGRAAAEWLCRRGVRVTAVDGADTESLRLAASELRAWGATVWLGAAAPPPEALDLAVVSPGVPCAGPLIQPLLARGVPVWSELELGYQALNGLGAKVPGVQRPGSWVAITGTNGKTTTTELVASLWRAAGGRVRAAGNIGLPLCALANQPAEWDGLVIEVSSFQLETLQTFSPEVAVLMNVTPDHLDRYAHFEDYLRAKARLFAHQHPSDWAIVQLEALAQLRSCHQEIPSTLITFSATDPQADLWVDVGHVMSRLPSWPGPLLDLNDCRLRGAHNAENLMAALAVGLVLDLPRDPILEALRRYAPAPHRCERVAEIAGVEFVNDSKATNVDAVRQALRAVRAPADGAPNVWLIAGGKDKGCDFGALGPELVHRVKGAYLIGETRHKLRAAWEHFTPCTAAESLLEAVSEAAKRAVPGDVVLLSPACSSFDQFQNYQHRGEVFRQAVEAWGRCQPPGLSCDFKLEITE